MLCFINRKSIHEIHQFTYHKENQHSTFVVPWQLASMRYFGNTLKCRHNDFSNHQLHDCLLNGLFRRRPVNSRTSWLCAQSHRLLPSVFTPTGTHDDVIKWKHFPRYWPFVQGIHRSPVNSPHKGQWRWALMFSFIRARINGWVNNHKAGNLRRYRGHYDVTVMNCRELPGRWPSQSRRQSKAIRQ